MINALIIISLVSGTILLLWKYDKIFTIQENFARNVETFKHYTKTLHAKAFPHFIWPGQKTPADKIVNLKWQMRDFKAEEVPTTDFFKVGVDGSVEMRVIPNNPEAIYQYAYGFQRTEKDGKIEDELLESIQVHGAATVEDWSSDKDVNSLRKETGKTHPALLTIFSAKMPPDIFEFRNFQIKGIEIPVEYEKARQEIKKAEFTVKTEKLRGKATQERLNAIAKATGITDEQARKLYELELQATVLEKAPAKVIIDKTGGGASRFIQGTEATN